MRRKSFLVGTLCGLVLGVFVSFLANAMKPTATPPMQPIAVLPVQPIVGAPNQPGRSLPPGWQPRYFNSQPYYIIPLDQGGES